MALLVVGSNHRLAPPSRLAAAMAGQDAVLAGLLQLQARKEIHGGVVLCTCNRLELILDADDVDISRLREQLFPGDPDLPLHEASGEEASAVVELDQTTVGRLSRMDAMRAQAMSVEINQRRK